MSNLKLQNISKIYDNNILYENINLEFPENGLVGIHGPSGTGKTTLLNIIGDLEKPTSGFVLGNDSKSFVFQDSNLLYDMNIYENLALYKVDKNYRNELLQEVGLLSKIEIPVKYLSGGEAQRLSIVRAILSGEKIILLDEPTSALDEHNEKVIYSFLRKISKHKLVIVVSHNVKLLQDYTDHIIEVKDRQISLHHNELKSIQENHTKEVNLDFKTELDFSFLKKYSTRLISTNKINISMIAVSIAMLLTLVMVTIILTFSSNENYLLNTSKQLDFDYYPLKYEVFNEPTNSFHTYTTGSHLYRKISDNEVVISMNMKFRDDNQNLTVFIDDKYEGVVITDLISDLYSIKKGDDMVLFDSTRNQLKFNVTKIITTNYDKEQINNYIFSIKESSKLFLDHTYDKYFAVKIDYETYISAYKNSNIKLKGNNFFISSKDYQQYTSDYNSISYISVSNYNNKFKDNKTLDYNEVIISDKFNDVRIGDKFKYKDLDKSVNKNLYLNLLNIYEIIEQISIVNIVDNTEIDVIISDEFMKDLIEKNYLYLDNINIKNLNKLNIHSLTDNDIAISYRSFEPTYQLIHIVKGPFSIILISLQLILLSVSFFIFYNFLNKTYVQKKKEIAILMSIHFDEVKVSKIFLWFGLFITFIVSIISFAASFLFLFTLNNILSEQSIFNTSVKLVPNNIYYLIYCIILINIFLYLIYIIIKRKIRKTEISILFKDGR